MIQDIKDNINKILPNAKIIIKDNSKLHEKHFIKDKDEIPSHLYIQVISNDFKNKTLVQRHRVINNIMSKYFEDGLHALEIDTKTEDEMK